MTESEQPTSAAQSDPLSIFSYRSRLGRSGYFLGLLLELGLLFLALVAFAMAMNPTGSGGGPGVFFVVAPIVVWIHSLITVQRLRDAGKPVGAQVLFVAVPIVLIGGSIAMLNQVYEDLGPIVLLILAVLVIPGLMPTKADAAANDAPPR
jgi:uncharacterized membrane protein YhaH (DUF805 family)